MSYLLLFWIHWIHVCCLILFFGCCWTAPWPKQWEHAGFFTSSKFEANRYGSSAGYHWACHHSWRWPTYLCNFGCALSQVWDKRQKIRIMHSCHSQMYIRLHAGFANRQDRQSTQVRGVSENMLTVTLQLNEPGTAYCSTLRCVDHHGRVEAELRMCQEMLPHQNWEALSWL